MARKPIVTDLFRFITVRNPQLLGEKQKEKGFAYFPIVNVPLSYFLNEFQELEDDKAVRKAYLEDKANSFSDYFTKLSSITELNNLLYSFSLWLMKNKNVLEKEVVAENSEGIEILGDDELVILWDNLLYQTITEKSSAIRDAILQMLVADNFLRKNDIDGNKELIKVQG